jgi:hypothetical protein
VPARGSSPSAATWPRATALPRPGGLPATAELSRLRDAPAWLLAALLAGIYLVAQPASADLAAQVYRADLFAHHGFVLWDSAWYAGHHIPGYSLLFPPLGALLGVRVVGAVCAVASAALFERLAHEHFGPRARLGALWFAVATAMNLVTGRLTFGLGVTIGLAAVLALSHRRVVLAAALAALATVASPVAGLFLGIVALACLIASPQRRVAALCFGLAAAVPMLALIAMFPEGGTEPFVVATFWPELVSCAFLLIALPRAERELRAGVVIYGLACVAAFVIPTPVGGNVVRLGALFAGPLLACVLWHRRTLLLFAMALPLLWWQWQAPIEDAVRAYGDPSVHASYYQPLLGFLQSQRGPFRVEIPFTTNHWEAAEVAPYFPLARGWERQLDRGDNGLFYFGALTPARYHAWLRAWGVRYVALPRRTVLDESAQVEASILRRGQPWLVAVFADRDWRVWRVRGAAPMAAGAGAMTAQSTDSFTLNARRAGTIVVRERYTPYWAIVSGRGCVKREPGGQTGVTVRGPGTVRVGIAFSPWRIGSESLRCR